MRHIFSILRRPHGGRKSPEPAASHFKPPDLKFLNQTEFRHGTAKWPQLWHSDCCIQVTGEREQLSFSFPSPFPATVSALWEKTIFNHFWDLYFSSMTHLELQHTINYLEENNWWFVLTCLSENWCFVGTSTPPTSEFTCLNLKLTMYFASASVFWTYVI